MHLNHVYSVNVACMPVNEHTVFKRCVLRDNKSRFIIWHYGLTSPEFKMTIL